MPKTKKDNALQSPIKSTKPTAIFSRQYGNNECANKGNENEPQMI